MSTFESSPEKVIEFPINKALEEERTLFAKAEGPSKTLAEMFFLTSKWATDENGHKETPEEVFNRAPEYISSLLDKTVTPEK